ncbi:uncharacterized protein LOC112214135 [Bombus impatiens]|uniref:Uncharacterized protein LOC112214135 n=1 Tax=Bombus impatiens TaxID=132113 RepID=A0A6P6FKA9_BOMIM|nr:uncharacterized protein LOC112214135 [Bombus impatiens]
MFANFAAIFSLTLAKTLQSHLVYLKIIVDNIINIFAENIIYRYFVCVFRLRKNSFVMFHIRQVKRNRGTRIRLLFTFETAVNDGRLKKASPIEKAKNQRR